MATGWNEARLLVHDSARPVMIRRLLQPMPPALQTARSDALRLGLRVVDEHKVVLQAAEIALVRLLTVDPDRRLLCEIVGGFPTDAPAPVWQCITILEGGAGLLSTTTRHPMPLAAGEIAQSFQDSSTAELIAAHRAALEELRSLRVELAKVTDARTTSATAHHLLGQPARDDRRGTARTLRANLDENRDAALGPIHSRSDLLARLAQLRSARP